MRFINKIYLHAMIMDRRYQKLYCMHVHVCALTFISKLRTDRHHKACAHIYTFVHIRTYVGLSTHTELNVYYELLYMYVRVHVHKVVIEWSPMETGRYVVG